MNILAFDTCLDKMYVSLESNNIYDSKIVETTKEHYHSAFLISTIKNILKSNNLTPQEIDVIATNTGPGSFTGIRACTTVARVFAQGGKWFEKDFNKNTSIKTIGVSSLEILSRIAPANIDQDVLVAFDARKNMAYTAIYQNKKEIFNPKTILMDDLKETIKKGRQFVICDDKLAPVLDFCKHISYQKTEDDLGRYLIEITKEKLATNGIETDWYKLNPLYIQPPPS